MAPVYLGLESEAQSVFKEVVFMENVLRTISILLARFQPKNTGFLNEVIEPLKSEAQRIILKFLLGIILTSVFVLSVFHLFGVVQMLLSQNEVDLLLQVLGFGLIAAASAIAIVYLFRDAKKAFALNKANRPSAEEILLEKIVLKFAEGIMDGLEAKESSTNTVRRQAEDPLTHPTPQVHFRENENMTST